MKAILVLFVISQFSLVLPSTIIDMKRMVTPRIQTSEKVYKVEMGGKVSLECSVMDLGNMVLMWKQGPRVLTAGSMLVRRDKRLKLEGNNLVISDLEAEDGGEYDCEIEADGDVPISVTHRLDILIPPRVTSEPADGNVVVKKGSSVSIKCVASGNPRPVVTWSKVNEVDVVGRGEIMELTQVTRHHEGVYQCSASNGVGKTAVSQIHLRVLHKPSVTAVESVVHAGVGHQAILACTVHSSPEAEVVWYRGTLLLETDNRMYREVVGTRHTLVIHHVREEEFTQYRCQATNTLGTHSATVTISGKPIAPRIESRVKDMGDNSYQITWITDSYASIEQYRLLYRKSPSLDTPNHSYAWTSVVIAGAQHTVQESYKNKASFILTHLEQEADYQVQVQAKNVFGWGKVSEQFSFQTTLEESVPVESLRKEFSIYNINSSPSTSSSCLLVVVIALALPLRW